MKRKQLIPIIAILITLSTCALLPTTFSIGPNTIRIGARAQATVQETTAFRVQTDYDRMYLDISHRYYKEMELGEHQIRYLRFVFTLAVQESEDNPFRLRILENGLESTKFEIELGKLPRGCTTGVKYILLETLGNDDNTLKFAVIVRLEAGNEGWVIENPKVYVENLLIDFYEELSYWNSPMVILKIKEKLLSVNKYNEWYGSLTPPTEPLPDPITIGVIHPEDDAFDRNSILVDIAEEEINQYLDDNGYEYDIEFQQFSAAGQASIHLEYVQYFDFIGVNLLLGGAWSSQAEASLKYLNDNHMILFSPSSTVDLLSIPDDNLFRLSPGDSLQGLGISAMLESKGKEAVLILQRADNYGDGIADVIEQEFNGEIIGRLRRNPEESEFHRILSEAEEIIEDNMGTYETSQMAVLLIDWGDPSWKILRDASDYPYLYALEWFGSEGTTRSSEILDNAGDEAAHVSLYGPALEQLDNPKYEALSERYFQETGETLGFYGANYYDICWIYANSIISTQTTDFATIKDILPEISADYSGASGWCSLDENGDRYPLDYQIWRYGLDEHGHPTEILCGKYHMLDDNVEWYE